MPKSPYLEYTYMRRAAEGGLTEAQHNVGVMYMQGVYKLPEDTTKTVDEVKALAWFMKASSRGYYESTINAMHILSRGTKCRSIPPNKTAALLCLERAKKTMPNANLDHLKENIENMNKPRVKTDQENSAVLALDEQQKQHTNKQ